MHDPHITALTTEKNYIHKKALVRASAMKICKLCCFPCSFCLTALCINLTIISCCCCCNKKVIDYFCNDNRDSIENSGIIKNGCDPLIFICNPLNARDTTCGEYCCCDTDKKTSKIFWEKEKQSLAKIDLFQKYGAMSTYLGENIDLIHIIEDYSKETPPLANID